MRARVADADPLQGVWQQRVALVLVAVEVLQVGLPCLLGRGVSELDALGLQALNDSPFPNAATRRPKLLVDLDRRLEGDGSHDKQGDRLVSPETADNSEQC